MQEKLENYIVCPCAPSKVRNAYNECKDRFQSIAKTPMEPQWNPNGTPMEPQLNLKATEICQFILLLFIIKKGS
jgi:hypothetical protein